MHRYTESEHSLAEWNVSIVRCFHSRTNVVRNCERKTSDCVHVQKSKQNSRILSDNGSFTSKSFQWIFLDEGIQKTRKQITKVSIFVIISKFFFSENRVRRRENSIRRNWLKNCKQKIRPCIWWNQRNHRKVVLGVLIVFHWFLTTMLRKIMCTVKFVRI